MYGITASSSTLLPSLLSTSTLRPTRTSARTATSRAQVQVAYECVQHAVGIVESMPLSYFMQDAALLSRRTLRQGMCMRAGEVTVTLRPRSGTLVVQQRGFRTRTRAAMGMGQTTASGGGGAGGGRGEGAGKGDGSIVDRLKQLISPTSATTATIKSAEAIGEEKYKSFQHDMHKLVTDVERNAFADGYVKAIHTGKGATAPVVAAVSSNRSRLLKMYILIVVIGIFLYLSAISEKGQIGSILFSSTQEVRPEDVQVTLDDVRGMEEAKKEVEEIVDYLQDPDKYSRLGGRLPKGVLLVGPPGTGKTLLARAIAGEAGVPFFHTSGSEFDEVLVGQGARRVRDLFDKAKARSPCIIFIDEIDSVGAKRVSNGIHPYANQTINQLLSEMDGFHRNEGIVVIAATNRVDDLDKALLRPGRFDVRVQVPKPDLQGRHDIFNYYLSKVIHDPNIDGKSLAKGTSGFTGADIESMINQAALQAAREDCDEVAMRHLDEARDRVIMGPARAGGVLPDADANRNTAYHEAGHTLVALFTKHAKPLHKVTIIPRGQSLGHTAMLPEKDEYQLTKVQMLAQLDVAMGGRVAEELIFGEDEVTTGASSDLKGATQIAIEMVKHFGMSEKAGLRDYSVDDSADALVKMPSVSPATAELIDSEINRLLLDSYKRVKDLLSKHKKEHHLLAEALLEHETLSVDEVRTVIAGKPLRKQLKSIAPIENAVVQPQLDLRAAAALLLEEQKGPAPR